jgi:hypothetical protein
MLSLIAPPPATPANRTRIEEVLNNKTEMEKGEMKNV